VRIDVGREQLGVARLRAAVAADVKVPALLDGNDAEVLALGLGTFADAAGDRGLQLVRGTQPLVAVLDADREADGILHAESAPGRTDAALDRTQRLGVRMAALEADLDQLLPDIGKLVDVCTEEIDALGASDLGIEVELARHAAESDQLLRRDLAAGDARDD